MIIHLIIINCLSCLHPTVLCYEAIALFAVNKQRLQEKGYFDDIVQSLWLKKRLKKVCETYPLSA